MDAFRQALQDAEDAVLVELSNKGIVKRAYKDLELEQPSVVWSGDAAEPWAEVAFAEAKCRIRLPLAESSCSCPSRSMCRHRIAAILWLKRESSGEAKAFTKEEVAAKRDAVPDKKLERQRANRPEKKQKKIDPGQAAQLAALWKETLAVQFATGLTRLSGETEESMERLAIMSHQAEFADLERGAREAGSLYRQYFSRAASFRADNLMWKMIGLYRQVELLERILNDPAEQERREEQLLKLAGSFRDAYNPEGELSLIGMGNRSFQSGTGYEGEIYYFLETETKKWYTWTDARPTFYEGQRARVTGGGRKTAPWGLNCTREDLAQLHIRLTGAKAAKGNRLSVSQDTRGEILKKRLPYEPAFYEKIVWDYRQLLNQHFAKPSDRQEETDQLALVGVARLGETVFDSVNQRFFLPLYDRAGRELPISLRYSKEERYTIRVLERLQKRIQEQVQKQAQQENNHTAQAFFGRLYLENGQLMLYPIEFFDGLELTETDMERQVGKQEQQDTQAEVQTLQRFSRYLEDVNQVLSDLFQSGLDSVLSETQQEIARLGREGEELGLHLAGEKLTGIGAALQAKRHQMCFSIEEILAIWSELARYLRICKEQTDRDTAQLVMELHVEKENRDESE